MLLSAHNKPLQSERCSKRFRQLRPLLASCHGCMDAQLHQGHSSRTTLRMLTLTLTSGGVGPGLDFLLQRTQPAELGLEGNCRMLAVLGLLHCSLSCLLTGGSLLPCLHLVFDLV